MKFSLGFLCVAVSAVLVAPVFANVATTAGSNLTAYNGTGATNNNQWNNLMNARGGTATTPVAANFGNCNAVVLRCATPKCSSGGCTDMSVARPIVAGCVNSNASCKKHGDELIDYITAQIVAQSNAKVQEQQNAVAIAQAQAEAQANAAAQSNAQMQQMQSQMAEMQAQMAESMAAMQQQMAAQSESQSAQIQSALDEQRASYESQAQASVGPVVEGLEGMGVAEQLAAKNGISADILMREQMSGKIETAIENAMTRMKELKTTLDNVLEYAGCDSSVTQCSGPKRVKKFKDLANQFFDPYEGVVEEMYDALILAMTVGVDVSDVIMLLSDSCNMWGKYICDRCTVPKNGEIPEGCECYGKDNTNCYYRVVTNKNNNKVAEQQPHCRMVEVLRENDTVLREWIDANSGMTGATQVACASDVVMNIPLFSGMRRKAARTLDVDQLRTLVNQDAYNVCKTPKNKNTTEYDIEKDCGAEACIVRPHEDTKRWGLLQDAVHSKKLPKDKDLCQPSREAMFARDREGGMQEVIKNSIKITHATGGAASYVEKTCAGYTKDECTKDKNCTLYNGSCIASSQVEVSPLKRKTVGDVLKSTIGLDKLEQREIPKVNSDINFAGEPDFSKFKSYSDCVSTMTDYYDGNASDARASCNQWYK